MKILSPRSVAVAIVIALGLVVSACAPSVSAAPVQAADRGKMHRVVVQVDESDPARMSLALNNVANLRQYYLSKGGRVKIEVVAYGPGLAMLVEKDSPVGGRVSKMMQQMPEVKFAACGKTLRGMEKREGHEIPLLEGVKVVPSGVVRLVRLQEAGWSYLRP